MEKTLNRFEQRYKEFVDSEFNWKIFLPIYTFVFLLLSCILLAYFSFLGKTLIYQSDGYQQHVRAFFYVADWGKEIIREFLKGNFRIPTFSFSIGYGGDILTTFHYYCIGDILAFIAVFLPKSWYLGYYQFLILFRIYLSGLTFVKYISYRKPNTHLMYVILGALSYIGTGYVYFAGFRHPYFINPMIYFPLLLWSIDYYLQEKKITYFVIVVALSSFSSFYFFYMIAIFGALYGIARCYIANHKNIKNTVIESLKIFVFALMGFIISFPVLLPELIAFFRDQRLDSRPIINLFYNKAYYKNLLVSLFQINSLGNWSYLYHSPIISVPIVLIFSSLKKYKKYVTVFLMLMVILVFPSLGSFLNGLSYPANRWTWVLSLYLSVMFVLSCEEWDENSAQMRKGILFYLIYYFLVIIVKKLQLSTFISFSMIISLIVLLVMNNTKPVIRYPILFFILVSNMIIVGYKVESLENFIPFDTFFQDTDAKSISSIDNLNNGFFRYSGTNLTKNASLESQLSTTQFYWSLSNSYVDSFQVDLANLENSHYQYNGLDDRLIPNLFVGAKYFYSKQHVIPYSYKPVVKNVYETNLYLPFIFQYDNVIDETKYQTLNAVERQEALLQGAFISENIELEEADLQFLAKEIDYRIIDFKDATMYDNKIITTKKDASIVLEIDGGKNNETYLYFKGLRFTGSRPLELYSDNLEVDPNGQLSLEQLTDDEQEKIKQLDRDWVEPDSLEIEVSFVNGEEVFRKKILNYTTDYYKWRTSRHDFVINSGYNEEDITKIMITLPKEGIYTFDSLQVMEQPFTNVQSQIDELKSLIVKDLDFHYSNLIGVTNQITGKVCLKKDGIVVFQIPYSSGWSLKIDNNNKELMNVNHIFLGTVLGAGEHEFELEYRTPGLTIGILLSGIGIICLLAVWIIEKRNK